MWHCALVGQVSKGLTCFNQSIMFLVDGMRLTMEWKDDRGDPWGQMNAPVTVCDDGSYCCGNTVSYERNYLSGPDCCAANQGVFLENGRPTGINPNANASTSSSASSAAGTNGPYSTPAKEITARTIVIGVIGGFASSALVVLGIRLVMIQKNMRANLAARESATLKLPDMIKYVNLGWDRVRLLLMLASIPGRNCMGRMLRGRSWTGIKDWKRGE